MDKSVQDAFHIDAIVTMVDAKHFQLHLDSEELQQQIAFADRLVLNKMDLIPDEKEQDALKAKISAINPSAHIIKSQYGNVPLDKILDVRGFDLEKVLDREPEFLRDAQPCDTVNCHNLEHNHVSYKRQIPATDSSDRFQLLYDGHPVNNDFWCRLTVAMTCQ